MNNTNSDRHPPEQLSIRIVMTAGVRIRVSRAFFMWSVCFLPQRYEEMTNDEWQITNSFVKK